MGQLDWVRSLSEARAAGRHLALLFDFDGTLAPIVPHPDLAAIPPGTREVLTRLAALDGVSLGVVSGRSLGDVKTRVALNGMAFAGSGGMQVDLDGEVMTDPALAGFEAAAEGVVAAIAPVIGKFLGVWLERKAGCLTIHFRHLLAGDAARMCDSVMEVLRLTSYGRFLRTREVSLALEVAPASGWTKGDAVDRIVASLPASAFPFYAGDAANDEEAVARLTELGGVAVGVGPDAPAGVSCRVADPAELAAGLSRLLWNLHPEFSP